MLNRIASFACLKTLKTLLHVWKLFPTLVSQAVLHLSMEFIFHGRGMYISRSKQCMRLWCKSNYCSSCVALLIEPFHLIHHSMNTNVLAGVQQSTRAGSLARVAHLLLLSMLQLITRAKFCTSKVPIRELETTRLLSDAIRSSWDWKLEQSLVMWHGSVILRMGKSFRKRVRMLSQTVQCRPRRNEETCYLRYWLILTIPHWRFMCLSKWCLDRFDGVHYPHRWVSPMAVYTMCI